MPIVNPRGGSLAVYFDPSNPAVGATLSASSLEVIPTTGSRTLYELGEKAVRVLITGSQTAASLQIRGITDSINVYLGSTGGTLRIGDIPGSVAVYFSPSNPAVAATFSGSIAAVPTTGSGDPIYEETGNWTRVLIAGSQTAASLTINGTLTGITNSIAAHVLSTGGTLWVKPDPAGTYFINAAHTVSIFTVTGSFNGVSDLGTTLVSPSASYNFKVFAFALTTTAQVHVTARFTNGAGSATEFWRYGLQAPSQGIAGANLAVTPPGFLFATGTNTTLALHLNTASLVHYSLSYIKESA